MRAIVSVSIYGVGLGLGTVLACVSTSHDPNHCMNNDGDAWCGEQYPDGSRPYCGYDLCFEDVADGCVEERPEPDCHSACGDRKKLSEDPDCEGVADTGDTSASDGPTTASTDSEPTTNDPTTQGSTMSSGETEASSTGPSGCTTSDECTEAAAPVCVDTQCVPCTDAADGDAECAAKDPNAPACRDDGVCVQCTSLNDAACADTTPVCDDPSSTCTGCTYHEQCTGTACDIATGSCFTDDCVVTVDGDDGAMADYDAIAPALADGCVVMVYELDGLASYQEALTTSNITVALLAADDQQPIVQGVGGNATLAVTNAANVYVQGIRFALNGSAEGVEVDGANLYLDRSQLRQNTGGGLSLTNGAYAQVRNCFVGANGSGAPGARGMTVSASDADILYSSLVRNDANVDDSLSCSGPSEVTVRNSILLGRDDDSIACAALSVEHSALDEDVGGMANEVMTLDTDWFIDAFGGDLHLSVMGAAVFTDIAQWRTADPAADPPRLANDPAVDIDGADPRPNVDGTADVAGADVPN